MVLLGTTDIFYILNLNLTGILTTSITDQKNVNFQGLIFLNCADFNYKLVINSTCTLYFVNMEKLYGFYENRFLNENSERAFMILLISYSLILLILDFETPENHFFFSFILFVKAFCHKY